MTTQFLAIQSGKIAYDETGSGPLVICLPSLGDVRGEYRFLAPALAQAGFRAVTADLRGHGESSTGWADASVPALGSDILALVRALGGGPAVVVGTSVSAASAVWAAAEEPALISGLVLIGPAVRGELTPANRLLFGALFARPWGPAAWAAFYNTLYPTRKPDDYAAYVRALKANLAEPGRIEAVRAVIAAPKTPAEQRLDRVSQPVQIIMGSKDPDFKDPTAEARWLGGKLNAHVQMIDGAGHYPHAEMPQVTAPVVVELARAAHVKVSHVA